MNPEHEGYTVKEMLSLVVIPALEDLKRQMIERDNEVEERISHLEAWRNRGIGVMAFVVAVLIPLSVPVIITVLNGTH